MILNLNVFYHILSFSLYNLSRGYLTAMLNISEFLRFNERSKTVDSLHISVQITDDICEILQLSFDFICTPFLVIFIQFSLWKLLCALV